MPKKIIFVLVVAITLSILVWVLWSKGDEPAKNAGATNELGDGASRVASEPTKIGMASPPYGAQASNPSTTQVPQGDPAATHIPSGLPLTTTYPELFQRASEGDQKAACRLVKEMEACERYAMAIAGDGKLGPYERVTDPDAMEALDRKIFGMSMESAAVVCAGFDKRRASHEQTPVMLTARRMIDSPVSVRAANRLHVDKGYDPENIKVIAARAAAGDMEAVNILATEDRQKESFYGKQVDPAIREEELVRWLTVLQFITKDSRGKDALRMRIAQVEPHIQPLRFQKIKQQAMDTAQKNFVESSLLDMRERGVDSVEDMCDHQ